MDYKCNKRGAQKAIPTEPKEDVETFWPSKIHLFVQLGLVRSPAQWTRSSPAVVQMLAT